MEISPKEEIKWKIFRKPILLSICIKKYIESSNIKLNILALLLLNQSFLLPNGRREVLGCFEVAEGIVLNSRVVGRCGGRAERRAARLHYFFSSSMSIRRAFFRLRSRRSTPLAPSAAPHETSPGQKWARVFSTP